MRHISNALTEYLASIGVDPANTKLRDLQRMLEGMPDNWRTRPEGPRGHCPFNLCGGAGFMRYDVPVGHPLFGKVQMCQCARDRAMLTDAERLAEYKKQMSAVEQTWTLANWIGTDQNARERAEAAVRQMWGIKVFIGDYGRGKSGLLAAIVNSALDRRMQASYVVVNDMLNKLRASYDPKDLGAFDRAVEQLCTVRVLALDEMWEYKPSEWTEQTLRTIIDERYRNYRERLTVIGANRMPEDGAIVSRLHDSVRSEIIEVSGPDLRPLAKTIAPPPVWEQDDWIMEHAELVAPEYAETVAY